MAWRRGAYACGWVAVGALLDELAYYVVAQHGVDRAVRGLNWIRDKARL